MQVQEDIYSRMKKLDKGDPYAAQTEEIGRMGVQQREDEKAAILADQAKFATAYDERGKRLDTRKADIAKREDKNLGLSLISAGATIMSTPGGLAKAIGKGALVGTEKFASGLEKIQTAKDLLDKAADDLEDLRLNRAEMSAKEIRLANINISSAKIKAKELTIAGIKEAGAKTDAKANAIVEATFRQMQSREASAAADRRADVVANRPDATERSMKELGDIGSGKASYMGKTGPEGVQAYRENRAAALGARYAGQDKSMANALAVEKLIQGDETVKLLNLQNVQLRNKTDKASQAQLATNEAEINRIRNRYKASIPGSSVSGGKVSATDPLGLGFGDT